MDDLLVSTVTRQYLKDEPEVGERVALGLLAESIGVERMVRIRFREAINNAARQKGILT